MEMKQIVELIQTVSKSSLSSFRYEEGDTCLTLEVNQNPVQYEEKPELNSSHSVVKKESKEEPEVVSTQVEGNLITSPIVGTFYCAKEEGAEPFVTVGDQVKAGQVIGIIEAMKLMNEVESQYEGTIVEVLVKDGMLVEYGQPLVRIV